MWARSCSALLLGLLSIPAIGYAYTSPGNPSGFVNDFAQVLSTEATENLNSILTQFSASTTNEIAVVTVPNLGGDYIENYAEKLFQEWKIGTAKNDNGVLLLLAIEDRESRIEVGYGLEGALPDSVADSILREMTPYLRDGDYNSAIFGAVDSIAEATRYEYIADDVGSSSSGGFEWNFEFLFIAFIVGVQWLAAILGRTKSWWLGGVLGAGIGAGIMYFFAWSMLVGGILTLALAVVGLILDYIVSKGFHSYQDNGATPPWYFGGPSSGGGFGGSGGFGGFGGGMSGGGGASGRW